MVENEPEKMNKDQQIGFHLGSLSTLSKERTELLRIAGITEQLMQMHLKALSDLGVDIKKFQSTGETKEKETKSDNKPKPPIDELL